MLDHVTSLVVPEIDVCMTPESRRVTKVDEESQRFLTRSEQKDDPSHYINGGDNDNLPTQL